jgi:hypothetical protein
MNKFKKKALRFVVIYIVLMVLAYGGVTFYFVDHFYAGSTINGISTTGKTVKDIEETISEDIRDYTLTVTMKDGSRQYIIGPEFQLAYVPDGSIQELKNKQNPFLWFMAFWDKESYTMSATTTYNGNMLRNRVDKLQEGVEIEEPQDAYIDIRNKKYVIVEEVQGNKLDLDKVYDIIKEAVDKGETQVDLSEYDCYQKPDVYAGDTALQERAEALNKFSEIEITYDFGDRTEILDGNTIGEWITIDENNEPVLDKEKIRAYVEKLGKKYDTFGSTREFITSRGEKIKVSGGDYGWVINRTEETNALAELIQYGESEEKRTPVYTYTAYNRNQNDIGDTYVEIDYTGQYMWFYKNGKLMADTPIVTGNMSQNFGSPSGVFPIVYKERNATLVGENYESPVEYWMPFYRNVGIHDAPWRNEFGGEIYRTSGSHGCINTPPAIAKVIFDNIEKGVPVVAYYAEGEDPKDIVTAEENNQENENTPANSTEMESGSDEHSGNEERPVGNEAEEPE